MGVGTWTILISLMIQNQSSFHFWLWWGVVQVIVVGRSLYLEAPLRTYLLLDLFE